MKSISVLFVLLLLSGCAGLEEFSPPLAPAKVSQASPQLPFPEPKRAAVGLDQTLLYDYLVGEIGARLGDFDEALSGYLEAARRAGDPYAAERATRIAWHVKRPDIALQAATLWVRLAPNNLAARQYYALALLRQGHDGEALQQLRAMQKIAEALGKDGLLLIAGALAREADRSSAVELMRRLVADRLEEPKALYALGVLMAAQQRWDEAERVLRQAMAKNPEWLQPYRLLAQVLANDRRRDEAVAVLREGIERFPDDRLLRTSLARQLVAMQRYDEALTQFRTLYRLAPDDTGVTYGYAMLATQQQRWDEARPLWQKLRANPRFASEATYFLAQVEESSGHIVTAIGLYRSVHRGELVADAAIRAAALLAREEERLVEARRLLQEARERVPKRAVDLYLAETQILRDAGAGPSQVLSVYAQGLRTFPANGDLLYARGLYYAEIGNYVAMERDFRQLLAQDPRNADALNALGYMLTQQGKRLEEARGYIQRALELKPESAAILDSMGWVLYRMGKLAEALEYLRKAHARDQDAEISGHLAEVLWSLGHRDEARQILDAALDKTPKDAYLKQLQHRFAAKP
ncbi:MAG: tetratricopeptide repeat protein [Gammaproteobacteria bacterium]|nr:MAG: tetratricopeptide repeat protein [Gammaproteobacteria bacterium]